MSIMHQLPSSLFLFCCLFFLFILSQFWKRTQSHKKLLPPGPWKLPFMGNLHQLIASSSIPHIFLRDLALKYGPIMHLQLGERSTVLISSPEAARQVLKTHELSFAERPYVFGGEILSYDFAGIFFTPYGSNWRNIRKVCVSKLLSTLCVHSFRSTREEEVWNLIDSISLSSSQGFPIPINFSHKVLSMVNTTTCKAAFGNKCKDQDEFLLLLQEILLVLNAFSISNLFPSLQFLRYVMGTNSVIQKLHRNMDKILVDIIDDHKMKRKTITSRNGKPGEGDLVDKLLKLQQSRELEFDITDNHIKSITLDLLAAGSDTPATLIEWAMSELVRNPKVMEKAQTEVRQVLKGKNKIQEIDIQRLDYLKLVIKETLRLHPPVPLIPRMSREMCQINGYEIPPNTRVFINTWAIGRDPNHWINADCFQPERFSTSSIDFKETDFQFIPFGAGRRVCPGISFGIASVELSLAQMLYHFDWKIPDGIKPEELDMTENLGVTCKRMNDLHLIAIPCIPFLN